MLKLVVNNEDNRLYKNVDEVNKELVYWRDEANTYLNRLTPGSLDGNIGHNTWCYNNALKIIVALENELKKFEGESYVK